MERIGRSILIGLAGFVLIILSSTFCQALTKQEIMRATHIVNLEAPIDFVVTIRYNGGTQDGFGVGVFHEGRLVGWKSNVRLNNGLNTFRLQDRNFTGDPGDYIVKLRYGGTIFQEKRFKARSKLMFTIDPATRFH
jgi:hypothetical protein